MTQWIAPLAVRPWAPRDEIAPQVSGSLETGLTVRSNGSRGCFGGWELVYPPGKKGDYFFFSVKVRWCGLNHGYEALSAEARWENEAGDRIDWTPINEWRHEGDWLVLHKVIDNDTDAARLVVQLLIRWSPTGEIQWAEPRLAPTAPPPPRRLRLGAGSARVTPEQSNLDANCRLFTEVARRAAGEGINLLCLPEVLLCWRAPGQTPRTMPQFAVEVPGPYIEPFQEVARAEKMAMCFSVFERERELIYNTALLIDESGEIVAKYRKVHLAVPTESTMGITPGDGFPVGTIRTVNARVGMNICMDSSAAESARAVARAGAEILMLPIMGDLRADRWSRGRPRFDFMRWVMIQQMRAMDNQIYLVAARNESVGSGIFAPDGTTLSIDCGDRPIVWADVDLNDLKESMSGAKVRDITWFERRESQYGVLCGDLAPTLPDWS